MSPPEPGKPRVFSGIQPTGELHLGNYLGAIRRWAEDQERVDGYFCIVDLHALTVPEEARELRSRSLQLAALLVAAGINPDRSTLFVQSHVHEHAELAWILTCLASFGELARMTQWKEKSEMRESASAGLFTYPALQAADILLYRADEVPVGDDQRQHVELTRDVAQRFNHHFGEVFELPRAVVPERGARIMDLQRVERKMSKTLGSPRGTLGLLDPPDELRRKVMSAVTDSGSEVRAAEEKPGITNLLDLLSALTGEEVGALEQRFEGRGYRAFKEEVAEAVIELLKPLQERYLELSADPAAVRDRLADGARKARAVARSTLSAARSAVGLLPPDGGDEEA